MVYLPFQDRTEAGRLLGVELGRRKPLKNPIVLALPRGGVVVAAKVAEALSAPLDIVVVRKLGVPWQPELAMGAIAGGICVLDHRLIHALSLSDQDVEEIVAQETREMERRERAYRRGLAPPALEGRTVVLVDDGLATGSTMVAAARHVRNGRPQELIIAVPVASSEACSRLRAEADECICLAVPEPFVAVGEWYTDFRQVQDVEVQRILDRSHCPIESRR